MELSRIWSVSSQTHPQKLNTGRYFDSSLMLGSAPLFNKNSMKSKSALDET